MILIELPFLQIEKMEQIDRSVDSIVPKLQDMIDTNMVQNGPKLAYIFW